MRRAFLALPLGLVLAGCMTYGDLAYTDPAVYRYGYPATTTYSYPYTTTYGYPYSYSVPQYVTPQPAIVAQGPTYYYPSTTYSNAYDWDRDGVQNRVDRFPTDPRRW
jgi:hypothetical protein